MGRALDRIEASAAIDGGAEPLWPVSTWANAGLPRNTISPADNNEPVSSKRRRVSITPSLRERSRVAGVNL
jgi:hypothetical protein